MIKNIKKRLGEVFRLSSGDFLESVEVEKSGNYPVFGGNGILGYTNKFNFSSSKIVIGRVGALCGNIHITPEKSWITDNALFVKKKLIEIDDDFLFEVLKGLNLNQFANKSGQPFISGGLIYPLEIIIPQTISEQKKVAKLLKRKFNSILTIKANSINQKESIQALQGAILRESFSWKTGDNLPKDWEWKKISTFLEVEKIQIERDNTEYSKLPFVGLENIKSHTREYTEEDGLNEPTGMCFKFSNRHVLYGKLRPYLNKVFIPVSVGKCSMELLPLKPKNNYSRDFIAAIMQSSQVLEVADLFSTGGRMPRADMKKIMEYKIAVPTDVNECNNLGKKISLSITKQLKLQQEAIKQVEAIEALPSAILREVFNFEESQSEDNLMMAAEPETEYKKN